MARLIIPTRNRPRSLLSVLTYLEEFYPGTNVIIADGSQDHYKLKNQESVSGLSKVSVEYRPYEYDLGFFDRILDVLTSESDEFFIMGADDDYPLMDTLNDAEGFLRDNPDYCTALGPSVKLSFLPDERLVARFDFARPVLDNEPAKRVLNFAKWSFPTTYAITRKSVLIERYKRLRQHFIAGFVDFTIGIHDSVYGKIKPLDKLGYIRTANHNNSYLRPGSNLIFLRRSEEVLQLMNVIKSDLVEFSGLQGEDADKIIEQIFKERIAELCGRGRITMKGFVDNVSLFNNRIIRDQYCLFREMFDGRGSTYNLFKDYLLFVSKGVKEVLNSDDNRGEPKKVETLEEQGRGVRGNVEVN